MPRQEKKVSLQIAQRKVVHYLPLTKVIRKWNDRNKVIEEPLFPSYVFVYLQSMHDYYNVLDAEGALFYVKFGKQIATVSETVINNLKTVIGSGNSIEVTADYFQAGQQVMIEEGPFTGLTCEVVEHEREQKILVRVQLLNRNVLTRLSSSVVACSNCCNKACKGMSVCRGSRTVAIRA
jgi:transcriptional antiterminator RfaH